MKCFYHEDREAAATYQRCGKGLCRECAAKYTPCLCDDCYEAIQAENHAQKVAAVEGRRQSPRNTPEPLGHFVPYLTGGQKAADFFIQRRCCHGHNIHPATQTGPAPDGSAKPERPF